MFGVLGTRLAVLAVLASAAIALIGATTAFHFVRKAEVADTAARIEAAINAQREAFTRSLWRYDDDQIHAQLDGLLLIPEIRHASVRAREGDRWSRGPPAPEAGRRIDVALVRGAPGAEDALGTLVVWFDFASLNDTLFKLGLTNLGVVGVASLVSGLVVLVLFHHLLGRHLAVLARFLAAYGATGQRETTFRFARQQRTKGRDDELDQIESALSRMLDTERRLRDTEDRLASALQNSKEGYALLDADDHFIYVNPEYTRLFPTIAELPIPGATFERFVRAAVERGDVSQAHDYPADWLSWRLDLHRDAREPFELFVLSSQSWARVREERLPGGETFVIASDISEQRQLEEELTQYRGRLEELVEERTQALESVQRELLRSERLATIGQLVGTVSHELRNPLGTIRSSFATMTRLVQSNDPRITRARDRIERSLERCVTIIEELLTYARRPELRCTEIDLDAWLNTLIAELDIPDTVALEVTLTAGSTISADPERLRQAVLNVVQNACQAMVEREEPRLRNDLHIATTRHDGRVHIEISDTGPGIEPDEVVKIFEPLYSTRNFGVGLGLPLVKRIAEQHGGGIDVLSRPGAGTTMVLWLPEG